MGWLAAIGVLTAFMFALTWLTVALGLAGETADGADPAAALGSGFVPTDTMPSGPRQFAEHVCGTRSTHIPYELTGRAPGPVRQGSRLHIVEALGRDPAKVINLRVEVERLDEHAAVIVCSAFP